MSEFWWQKWSLLVFLNDHIQKLHLEEEHHRFLILKYLRNLCPREEFSSQPQNNDARECLGDWISWNSFRLRILQVFVRSKQPKLLGPCKYEGCYQPQIRIWPRCSSDPCFESITWLAIMTSAAPASLRTWSTKPPWVTSSWWMNLE